MDHGVIQQVGTPIELFDEPANRFVAGFVGSVNLFEGELRAGDLFVSPTLGECRLPAGARGAPARTGLPRVSPARRASRRRGRAGRRRAGFEGTVAAAAFQGDSVRYEVRVGGSAASSPSSRIAAAASAGATARRCACTSPRTSCA